MNALDSSSTVSAGTGVAAYEVCRPVCHPCIDLCSKELKCAMCEFNLSFLPPVNFAHPLRSRQSSSQSSPLRGPARLFNSISPFPCLTLFLSTYFPLRLTVSSFWAHTQTNLH